MCTGHGSPRCVEERLAWQLYDEHGYRPRDVRPCLTASRDSTTDPTGHRRRPLAALRNRLGLLSLRYRTRWP